MPPLYGPIAPLNCTRHARFIWISPLSFSQTTRNETTRSGSDMRSRMHASRYRGVVEHERHHRLGHLAHGLMELGLMWIARRHAVHESIDLGGDAGGWSQRRGRRGASRGHGTLGLRAMHGSRRAGLTYRRGQDVASRDEPKCAVERSRADSFTPRNHVYAAP